MRYLTYADRKTYQFCLLVPEIRREEIFKAYLEPFPIGIEELMAIEIHKSQTAKKTPAAEIKEWVTSELAPVLNDCGTEYLIVADADTFKALTKSPKVEANLGYVLDCTVGPWKVVYVPNYRQIFYDPEKVTAKIAQSMNALLDHRVGAYQAPGHGVLKFAAYPETDQDIEQWLIKLLEMDCPLSIDIEAFDLKHHKAGIGTISFAWNEHEGIAFAVDYVPRAGATSAPYGKQGYNTHRRRLLRRFFELLLERGQKGMYHNIAYDAYVLIYQLFMDNLLDTEGLLEGMRVMLSQWDCTKLIAYLATNSCAGNVLGLKALAQEFAGNYAVDDIEDITRLPLHKLLEYNLVDACSTWYVHNKHYPVMVADQQLDIYKNLFKPATLDIVQMQLTGLPVKMSRVVEVKAILQADQDQALDRIQSSFLVQEFTEKLKEDHVLNRNAKLKKKQISITDEETLAVRFNPNSGDQLRDLLYEFIGLPIISTTDAGQASTDTETLEALRSHTKDQRVIELLDAMLDLRAVAILLSTFIPALEGAAEGPDGWHYLFGNFNLGGTLSGRLSSSKPNLQNIPANGKGAKQKLYAKLIKSCFVAPPGWLFTGLDFDSLEDRISALTTKDPNKLKVYTDGYDGHCLRAHAYFGDKMPDIDPNSVVSINSIAEKYGDERQESKVPTFALTYQGTFRTLMVKCGFSEAKARMIEERYHELYKVSDQWIADRLKEAAKTGYITAAFGLRVRTPLLKQTISGTRKTPYEATAEGRSAGNALGQSWCLLNTRASVEFMGKVRTSPYRTSIKPCAHIHDAQYFLMKDDVGAILYANNHLVTAVQWQHHPDIAHSEVKLGGKLGIFWPNWTKEITIPNGVTEAELVEVIESHLAKQG